MAVVCELLSLAVAAMALI